MAAPAVEALATAPATGRAVVTAVHIRSGRVIYVACSRCGTRVTNTYGPDANRDEIRAGRTAAAICTQAHARNCTADRVKRSALAATESEARR